MRVLCVCERGNSRSAGLATLLREHYGVESLSCGVRAVTVETWWTLYAWADLVILMAENLRPYVPSGNVAEVADKLVVCEVGDDRYWYGIHPELAALCQTFLSQCQKLKGHTKHGIFGTTTAPQQGKGEG